MGCAVQMQLNGLQDQRLGSIYEQASTTGIYGRGRQSPQIPVVKKSVRRIGRRGYKASTRIAQALYLLPASKA